LIAESAAGAPHILIVGYGDLGQKFGQLLIESGLQITGLRRSEHPPSSIRLISGDVTHPESLGGLQEIAPDILVYCVAATQQSDDNYRAHYVDGLRHVLATLPKASRLRHVFFVSSTRVYGQETGQPLTELDAAIPTDFGGIRLLQAEQVLDTLPCGHSALRLSGIYGPGRNRMMTLARHPENWPQQNNWSNRIHRDDAAAFIVFLIRQVLQGGTIESCYIVTDSQPAPQHEVLHWLAEQMGTATDETRMPAPHGGKRLSNARMLETGFRLNYPDYQTGYAALLQETPQ